MVSAAVFSIVVALLLLILCYSHCFVGSCVWSLFCCAVLSVVSSFAITTLGKREREAERGRERQRERWLLYVIAFDVM